ncbi:MAG: response regulator, partial [Thiotrichales bacterium]|nr:response regulator [Thiotrichales bacterium]
MQDSTSYISSAEVPVLERTILIVEDETVLARAVQKRLNRSGFKSDIAGDLHNARTKFSELSPDLVLLDMRLPDGSGLDFLSDIRSKEQSNCAVLVMSAYGEIEDAVSAMKLGASDYLKKPVDLDELMLNIEKVFSNYDREQKLTYSAKREQHAVEGVEFLGECRELQDIRSQVDRIAALSLSSNSIPPTILILGETGTGK